MKSPAGERRRPLLLLSLEELVPELDPVGPGRRDVIRLADALDAGGGAGTRRARERIAGAAGDRAAGQARGGRPVDGREVAVNARGRGALVVALVVEDVLDEGDELVPVALRPPKQARVPLIPGR